ncbi:uncharacterized protein LOC111080674 [Drosophila obscura]|uniref:uncharacterized protein LOC111080674 n=1 Tax=Drosophila obscura TaxID=7282 RepID=UPI001BB1C82C|nr:uncharacterized protein LOC111080674 [Drosophila obscura]
MRKLLYHRELNAPEGTQQGDRMLMAYKHFYAFPVARVFTDIFSDDLSDAQLTKLLGGGKSIPATGATSSHPISLSSADHFDVVFNWESTYQYPVSFELFMCCINYDELIGPLLKYWITDESRLPALLAKPHDYHSFYVDPSIRRLFNYRFKNS